MAVLDLIHRLFGTLALGNEDEDLQDLVLDDIFTINKPAADAAAGTDYSYGALKVPFDIEVVSVTICPHGTLTANDTNFATITLEKADGAAGSATAVASVTTETTGSGDWAADTFVELTLDESEKEVDDGQILIIESAKDGTGVAVPISSFTVRYRRR